MRRIIFVLPILLSSCFSSGDPTAGLAPRPADDQGPSIIWNVFEKPLPEIPFPNNIATRFDDDSPTKLRLNISEEAVTAHESKLRRLINTLDGFGNFAPIWLSFDGLLEIEDIYERHSNTDFSDDAVYLVNLNPESDNFGQPVFLDMGNGRFPATIETNDNYFQNDPRDNSSNLLFETEDEDLNGNGQLDYFEDTDGDGTLDKPNLWGRYLNDPERMDRYNDLITFYEFETNTLIFRPVFALEPESTYAVVITRRVKGAESDSPVRSPFPYVNHMAQSVALKPLVDAHMLSGLGLEVDDVAFAWSFTTQSVTRDLEALRAGLYGEGDFDFLGEDFPARIAEVAPFDSPEHASNIYTLDAARFMDVLGHDGFRAAAGVGSSEVEISQANYLEFVDYLVGFTVDSPALIENDDGVFRMNSMTGEVDYTRESIQVMCVVPKESESHKAPFPITFYGHGYTSTRLEMLGFAPNLARFGLASCAIDSYGHGVEDSEENKATTIGLLGGAGLLGLADFVLSGRARDLNADGVTDAGGDFWTANTFHTRDVVRQTILDYMQVIRVMRSFGQETMPVDVDGSGSDEVAGDFNGDGVPDMGGEQSYTYFGQSLGGIIAMVLGSIEPAVVATAPSAGGAGLADIAVRSRQGGVVQAVFLPLLGPIIVATPGDEGELDIAFDALNINYEVLLPFAEVDLSDPSEVIKVGDVVQVANLDNGEVDRVVIQEPAAGDPVGLFRLQIAADIGDRLQLHFYRRGEETHYREISTFQTPDLMRNEFYGQTHDVGSELIALNEGFGHRRGTPALRRLLAFAQMVVDKADPGNYAPLYQNPIYMRPEGAVPANTFVINSGGDMNVPINTGIAFARAAGAFGVMQPNPDYGITEDQLLIDTHVVESIEKLRPYETDPCHYDSRTILFDIDEMSEGLDPEQGPHLSEITRSPSCDGSVGQPAICLEECQSMPPLRATTEKNGAVVGMRIPFIDPTGRHGFDLPKASDPFDHGQYLINQVGYFFATDGQQLVDDLCLVDSSCTFFVR